MQVQPYLNFDGRCDEALEFYKNAVGAEVQMLMRFKDAPDQSMVKPGSAEKVMHSTLKIGESMVLASDGQCGGHPDFKGVALALTAKAPDAAEKYFNALAEGGQVTMPMAQTFFASRFGMLTDKFGVGWMVLAMT
jgi:PhnB protein